MDTDAYANRPPSKRGARCRSCLERSRRRRKRDEERVALRVHLDPTVRRDLFSYDPPMFSERIGIGFLAELAQQPSRSLDVGEQKRHGPGGQRTIHSRNDEAKRRGGETARFRRRSRRQLGERYPPKSVSFRRPK